MTKKTIFIWADLLFPWLTLIVGAALCVVGAVYAPPLPAKIICVILALLCLSGIPVWYLIKGKSIIPDFITRHGVLAATGLKNIPSPSTIEGWTDDLVKKWSSSTWLDGKGRTKIVSANDVYEALKGVTVFFMDTEDFNLDGREMHGYSQGQDAVVGYRAGDAGWVVGLFRHEVSHVILCKLGEVWDEATHHRIFKEIKL